MCSNKLALVGICENEYCRIGEGDLLQIAAIHSATETVYRGAFSGYLVTTEAEAAEIEGMNHRMTYDELWNETADVAYPRHAFSISLADFAKWPTLRPYMHAWATVMFI